MESKNQNKQTAVEFLIEKWATQGTLYSSDMYQAKDLENQQRIEDMQKAWNASEQNMRSQFSSSTYKDVKFEEWLETHKKEWFEQFKNK